MRRGSTYATDLITERPPHILAKRSHWATIILRPPWTEGSLLLDAYHPGPKNENAAPRRTKCRAGLMLQSRTPRKLIRRTLRHILLSSSGLFPSIVHHA